MKTSLRFIYIFVAIIATIIFMGSCATPAVYLPQDTPLTITISSTSEFANLELTGLSVTDSTVDADLITKTDVQGQWVEPVHGVFRSTQWGPDFDAGKMSLNAVWHPTLAPAPDQVPGVIRLNWRKGHIGNLDITIEGPGADGKLLTITRHFDVKDKTEAGSISIPTSKVLKVQE